MPLKMKKKAAGIKNWLLVIGAFLLAVLMVVTTALTVDKVISTNRYEEAAAQYQSESQELESALSSVESERDAAQSALSSATDQLADKDDQLASASSQIASQSKEIKKKDKTIKSLKTRISLADAGKTTVVTKDQALPDRDYPDYTGKKLVALTFDDGPGKYTERLLNELKKRDAKATFFVLGNRVEKNADLLKRMEAEGHCVGSHSYEHKNLTRLSYSGVQKDLDKTATKIQKVLGHKPEVMRCPGGSCNDNVKKYAKEAGIPIIYWTVDTRDWESKNVNKIMQVSFGKNGIQDGSIVLMHDIHETSVDAAIKMMDKLQKQGYTLVTVPELLMAREGKITPGVVYK